MNWRHLQAIVWLRWRLLANQWRRSGAVNAVLMTIIVVACLVTAVPLFVGSVVAGAFLLPKAAPVHLLYIWDGLVLVLVFFWSLGLLTELQRTESLSLSKFLHLPLSIKEAFLINYVSSLVRLSLIVFVPIMLGLAVALVYVKGPSLLLVVPLLLAFLLMISALTYQFQGWLASLMNNPRRRRTVVVVTTAAFVLLLQLPSFLNFAAPWHAKADQSNRLVEQLQGLQRAFEAHEFDAQEHVRRQQELIQEHQRITELEDQQTLARLEETARVVNQVLPLGWMPLGVMAAAEGNLPLTLLATAGMTLIGSASLWRAYRTTLGIYRGQFTSQKSWWRRREPIPVSAPAAPVPLSGQPVKVSLLERQLPGLPEAVSAIALAGFRSLTRAPEAKMMLMTPLILSAFFGFSFLRHGQDIPLIARPLIALAALALVQFGMLQLMANQFGFDRDGFRVFVLSSVPRPQILLGKNLAFAPLALAMAAILVTVVQVIAPLRLDHLLALLPQTVSAYLLFCLLANLVSIMAPMPIAAGSLKPASVKLIPMLLQMVMFFCLFPLTQIAALLPVGIEALLQWLGWIERAPISLLVSVIECGLVVVVYHFCLGWQGSLFQAREQKILESVTGRAA